MALANDSRLGARERPFVAKSGYEHADVPTARLDTRRGDLQWFEGTAASTARAPPRRASEELRFPTWVILLVCRRFALSHASSSVTDESLVPPAWWCSVPFCMVDSIQLATIVVAANHPRRSEI